MSGTIDRLYAIFARYGDESYGESVTQRDHALQSAELARQDGASDTLIAAALLHDIGQFMDEAGHAAERDQRDAQHEELGSAILAASFPPAVTEPVRLHVAAKRYLAATRPGYVDELSRASLISLGVQGGPMSADEVAAFEANPHFGDAVRLRTYDDGGKRDDGVLPSLESYRPLLERLVR